MTSVDTPSTSLIICSRNRPELLADTVTSVLAGEDLPTEIIIVDQSDVPHPSLACHVEEDCRIRYLWTPSTGKGQASNRGVAAARFEVLVFTDDDVLVTPSWFGTLVRALLAAGPHAVVTGQVRPSREKLGGFAPATKVDREPAVYEGRVGNDVLYGLNMAMCRSAVDEVGGFDERLGPGSRFCNSDDNDLGFRLLEAGYCIMYVPEAVLYHRAWRSEADYLPLRWSYGVGRGAFYAKHMSLQDHYMLRRLLRDVRVHALLFLRRVRHERRLAYGDITLAVGILYGALSWLLTQRRMQPPTLPGSVRGADQ